MRENVTGQIYPVSYPRDDVLEITDKIVLIRAIFAQA